MATERIDNALGTANRKLETTVREQPFLQHVLDMRLVLRAAAIGLVAALLMWLIVGPATGGFALLLFFFGTWLVLARVHYDRRRETREADERRREAREGQPAGAS